MKRTFSLLLFASLAIQTGFAESRQRFTFELQLITTATSEGPLTVKVDDDSPLSVRTPSGHEIHLTIRTVHKGDRDLVEVTSRVDVHTNGQYESSALPTVYLSGPGAVDVRADSGQADGQLQALRLNLKAVEPAQDLDPLAHCPGRIELDKSMIDLGQQALRSDPGITLNAFDGVTKLAADESSWAARQGELESRYLEPLSTWSRCRGGDGVVLLYLAGSEEPDGTYSVKSGIQWEQD